MTVVEFHAAGEIQLIIAPKLTPSRNFLIPRKDNLGLVVKSWAHFLNMNMIENVCLFVCL